jgi:N-acetylglucosamine kinase-like BadF-type ATPase
MSEQQQFILGIDGGGTKTHAVLSALDGTVVAERFGGASNLQIAGIPKAAETVFKLADECCKWASCQADAVQSIVVGLAGAGRPADKTSFVDALISLGQQNNFPIKNVIVETDARVALEAAFAGGSGIVIIAGTGSIGLYRTKEGTIYRAGGWGRILGDEGSSFAIARDALAAVMRAHDERGEKTVLTEKAFQQFRVTAVEDLIPRIYQDAVDITGFTLKVLFAAEDDHVAREVLSKNADALVELVQTLLKHAPPQKKAAVALMGGLLTEENAYSTMVKEKIVAALPQQVLMLKPKFTAAFGAAIIGLNAFQ